MMEIDDMLTFASKEQQDQIFSELTRREKAFALGFTEPQAGSESSAIVSSARREGGKVIIDGTSTSSPLPKRHATCSPYG